MNYTPSKGVYFTAKENVYIGPLTFDDPGNGTIHQTYEWTKNWSVIKAEGFAHGENVGNNFDWDPDIHD